MWKREEPVRPSPTPPAPAPQAPIAAAAPVPFTPQVENVRQEKVAVNIGKSVIIKGELSGSEDLTIEGQVDGKIELRQNVLTIGPNGKIKAQVFAKSVVILGEVTGNVTASEKVDIRDNGSVDGDIAAPRVAIAEGAHFRGSIDMQRPGGTTKATDKAESKPAAAAPSQPAATSSPATSGATAGASR